MPFGDQAELLAVDVVPRRDAARVNTVWRFPEPGTALFSVHFVGTDFESRQQELFCGRESVGQPLAINMIIYEGKYELADAVEISISFNGQEVAPKLSLGNVSTVRDKRYVIHSRERIEESLRVSRLPVLIR